MDGSIGSCVICAQNLCINNFSSLPCGHTFHYKCVLRWLLHSEQCPTCRARTLPKHIVKRLYFANCNDKTMNDAGSSATATTADHNNKSASTTNTSGKIDEVNAGFHNNDEEYDNEDYSDDYSSDPEDGIHGLIDDSTDSDDSSEITVEDGESETETEGYGESEEFHETSDADMASVLDASISDTSSVSLGTFSEAFSEDDAVNISSVNYDNMETINSFDNHEEVGNNDNNTHTSVLLTEHVSGDDNGDISDDEHSSGSDDSNDSNDDFDSHEFNRLLDCFTLDLRVFNRYIS
ncbi:hypothetical protein LOAG_07212 [Loa loa]|uniref:RING-type domain-containing protein n=1 Tax=Loa loa TaxID=7209 RepID=A0A1I7V934_LOALO|nr:hypothetical protein LOAG_07212 [Loa loa]EFO21272.2 hypothetical protein LOAG_07212 [Loa loa]